MEVLLESEGQMGRNKQKGRGKRQRPAGPSAASPAVVADQTGRLLAERENEWLERLTTDPASFAAVELEVHEQARRQADLYVAGLLAKASERPELAPHVDQVTAAAEVPLRPVEKKLGWQSFLDQSIFKFLEIRGRVAAEPPALGPDRLAPLQPGAQLAPRPQVRRSQVLTAHFPPEPCRECRR